MRFLAALMPVVRVSDRSVAYNELLVRVDGVDCTTTYVMDAERTGRIHVIDFGMLHRAIVHLGATAPEVCLGVNLSVRTIERADPALHVMLRDADRIASRLVLEITETAAPQDRQRIGSFSASMRERGIRVAVDDFGRGHMDAGMVARINPDLLKVDTDLLRSPTRVQRRVIEAHVDSGRQLVVERVSSAEDIALASSFGATLVQGHVIGPVAPLGVQDEWRRWGFSGAGKARRIG